MHTSTLGVSKKCSFVLNTLQYNFDFFYSRIICVSTNTIKCVQVCNGNEYESRGIYVRIILFYRVIIARRFAVVAPKKGVVQHKPKSGGKNSRRLISVLSRTANREFK